MPKSKRGTGARNWGRANQGRPGRPDRPTRPGAPNKGGKKHTALPISFIGVSDFNGSRSLGATINLSTLPAGRAAGDLMVLILTNANNPAVPAAPAAQSGWTEVGSTISVSTNLLKARIFYKTYTSGTSIPFDTPNPSGGLAMGRIMFLRNATAIRVARTGTRVSADAGTTIPTTDLIGPIASSGWLITMSVSRTSANTTIPTATNITFDNGSNASNSDGGGSGAQWCRFDTTNDVDLALTTDITFNIGDNTEAIGYALWADNT